MKRREKFEDRPNRRTIFKPNHAEPGEFYLDYVLLPYGIYYDKTKPFADAKQGDILRFYNGPEYVIDSVSLIKQDRVCDVLCRMRYGISWKAAFEKWKQYAMLEGNGKDILSTEECLLVVYEKRSPEK